MSDSLVNTVLALGSTISPTVTILGGPYKRLQAFLTIGPGYDRARLDYNDTPFVHAVTVLQTPAFIAGTSTTLAMPDLTAATGFLTSWEPGPSASTAWGVVAQTVNDGPPVCVEGGISRLASAGGTN